MTGMRRLSKTSRCDPYEERLLADVVVVVVLGHVGIDMIRLAVSSSLRFQEEELWCSDSALSDAGSLLVESHAVAIRKARSAWPFFLMRVKPSERVELKTGKEEWLSGKDNDWWRVWQLVSIFVTCCSPPTARLALRLC